MVEAILNSGQNISVPNLDVIVEQKFDLSIIRFIDMSEQEMIWLRKELKIDFRIMRNFEDFEISSHFLSKNNQLSFHFTFPYYDKDKNLLESQVFVIIYKDRVFLFLSKEIDLFLRKNYAFKIRHFRNATDIKSVFQYQIQFISDYFADIIEVEAKKVKLLANEILLEKKFKNDYTVIITKYLFNNLLVKELLMETTKVFFLYKKSDWNKVNNNNEILDIELYDMSVISDYIKFNIERLDGLKENVSNTIELQQNYIFKMLTVFTICMMIPTLIAGIFGMNFDNIPGSNNSYGFWQMMLLLCISAYIPYFYLKRRKWL